MELFIYVVCLFSLLACAGLCGHLLSKRFVRGPTYYIVFYIYSLTEDGPVVCMTSNLRCDRLPSLAKLRSALRDRLLDREGIAVPLTQLRVTGLTQLHSEQDAARWLEGSLHFD